MRMLGVKEVVDYTGVSSEEWVAAGREVGEVGLVVDVVDGKTLAGCQTAMRKGGALVRVNTPRIW
jgi:NADPH:quinone reductase-like Zn-dependent oxidoreductase